jgi:hypothetical protein
MAVCLLFEGMYCLSDGMQSEYYNASIQETSTFKKSVVEQWKYRISES